MSGKIEQVRVEEYVGTFNDFVTNVEKVFIFKAASDRNAGTISTSTQAALILGRAISIQKTGTG